MFTLAEKICLGIVGIEVLAFGAFTHQIKKASNKQLETIYGTSDIDEIMRMSKEDVENLKNNR